MYNFSVFPFDRFNQFVVVAVVGLHLFFFSFSFLLYSLFVKFNIHKICENTIRCRGLVFVLIRSCKQQNVLCTLRLSWSVRAAYFIYTHTHRYVNLYTFRYMCVYLAKNEDTSVGARVFERERALVQVSYYMSIGYYYIYYVWAVCRVRCVSRFSDSVFIYKHVFFPFTMSTALNMPLLSIHNTAQHAYI